MVLKTSSLANGNGHTTSSTTANKGNAFGENAVGVKSAVYDSRNDATEDFDDSDSDSDEEGYTDFLTFLSTPEPSPNVSPNANVVEKKELKKEDEPVAIVEKAVETKKVAAKANNAVVEAEEDEPVEDDAQSLSIGGIIVNDHVSLSTESSDPSSELTIESVKSAEESNAGELPSAGLLATAAKPISSRWAPAAAAAAAKEEKVTSPPTSTPSPTPSVVSSTAPIAIEYFTNKATIDQANLTIEMRALAKQNMAPAHAHFDQINHANAIERSAQIEEMIKAPRPAAVEYFTALDMESKQKKKEAIAEEAEAGSQAPPAVEYFTKRARDEKEKKAAEIEELKNNPPPPSMAGSHFQEVEEKRKSEIASMAQEPASLAVEHFTDKAKVEKSKRDLMLKDLNENPPAASAATKHFVEEKKKKVQEQEAIRSQVKSASGAAVVEPLPFDHFNKQGQASTEARATAARELSESHMPIGVKYFTAKGAADKAAREAETRELSQREMSMAGRHFAELAEEKMAASVASAGGAEETMPAAIQHFTVADRATKAKKNAEIELLKENPPPLSKGQEYFTRMDSAAKGKKAVEIQALKDNPPPPSVAGVHFQKVEERRKSEIASMAQEPASLAVEHFTNKAKVEKSQRDLMLMDLHENPPAASAATKHFVEEKKKKEQAMEATRARAVKSSSGALAEPLPMDHFTKLGEKEMADRALASKMLAESQMPSAIKYFTAMGVEDKKAREAELRELSEQSQSMAGRHFAAAAAEKEEAKKVSGSQSGADVEAMPAAIQHFTVMAHEQSMRKQAELKSLRSTPPEVSVGVAHFTAGL